MDQHLYLVAFLNFRMQSIILVKSRKLQRKDKSLNRETLKIIKNESIIDCKEQTEQMAREDPNEERMKNAVSIKGKIFTYAEALLKGTKSGEKKVRFKMQIEFGF